jgi:acetolactate synthase-1/2/3 large subunit
LRGAVKRAIARREPSLIEVPVGPMPSPWEFIHMPRIRGK